MKKIDNSNFKRLIGAWKTTGDGKSATMQYFNTKGEDGIMTSTIQNNEFKIEGKGLKFNGTINDANTKIAGKWYRKMQNDKWADFIDLTLEKQKDW